MWGLNLMFLILIALSRNWTHFIKKLCYLEWFQAWQTNKSLRHIFVKLLAAMKKSQANTIRKFHLGHFAWPFGPSFSINCINHRTMPRLILVIKNSIASDLKEVFRKMLTMLVFPNEEYTVLKLLFKNTYFSK